MTQNPSKAGETGVGPSLFLSDDGVNAVGDGLCPSSLLNNKASIPFGGAKQGASLAVLPGRFQEEYKRLGVLGQGAFGTVWRCQRVVDGKQCAVKAVRYRVMTGESSDRSEVERKILREAEMLAQTRHPNILHYHRSWVEIDESVSGGDSSRCSTKTGSGTSFSSSFQSPTTLAPKAAFGCDSTSSSTCSYDCGSDVSGVCFERQLSADEEEQGLDPEEQLEATWNFNTNPENPITGDDGHRCISLAGSSASDGSVDDAVAPLGEDVATARWATFYMQVELCREETLLGWIASRNTTFYDAATTSGTDAGTASTPDAGYDVLPKALGIFTQCAHALAHMHERNMIHRDVKPANIFFAQDGAVRLGDFGLAKVIEQETEHQDQDGPSPDGQSASVKGRSKTTVGTPSYASPEQKAGDPLRATSDVYSLGLVLVELLCPVRTQMERVAVLEGLRMNREVPASGVAVSKKLANLAVWMTDPDPAKRPTARDIVRVSRQVRQERRRGNAALRSAAEAAHNAPTSPPGTLREKAVDSLTGSGVRAVVASSGGRRVAAPASRGTASASHLQLMPRGHGIRVHRQATQQRPLPVGGDRRRNRCQQYRPPPSPTKGALRR